MKRRITFILKQEGVWNASGKKEEGRIHSAEKTD
jgi:hypothetical protein